ncbi:PEP-CTERM sorting domain-containing protein [Roseateles sp. DC23W]|uniref:PEP-CTERM sorting domain-containing protein n=1 Tax=Pelomonas dachongensis TaxID=3299029 RepID=A0ABW7EH22_9BURK
MRIRSWIAAAALALTAPAWALPVTKVEWVQRTGTTNGTDAVEIWLRLTTHADASPLFLDGSTTSFDAKDFETLSNRGFARIDRIYNSGATSFGRGDNFCPPPPARGCSDAASPWRFQFNRGADSFFAAQAEHLAAGQSRDYLFATFTPKNGAVAPGIYSLGNAELSLGVDGVDVDGNRLAFSLRLGATCGEGAADCAFSRTVTAVPEPATAALMGLGLLGMVMARNWRRQRPG